MITLVEPGTQYRETKVAPKDWKRHVKITQGLYQREVQIWGNLSFEKKSNSDRL